MNIPKTILSSILIQYDKNDRQKLTTCTGRVRFCYWANPAQSWYHLCSLRLDEAMRIQVSSKDWHAILHLTGTFTYFYGFTMVVPIIVSIFFGEYKTLVDFALGFMICVSIGLLLRNTFRYNTNTQWVHGMSATALSWLIVMLIAALPYYWSGFFNSYVDACFDTMSGITTTGLTLIQNVDHIPISLNIWRHVLTFIGGQGVILVALSFVPPAAVGFQALVGEGKEEKLIPNVKDTGKAIWFISFFFMFVGLCIYFLIGLFIGLEPGWSLFHGFCIFMSSWSTGGFAPQMMNTMYYHSFLYEFACMIFFILGSMNFGLHYYVWFKDSRELLKDIETRSFIITLTITSILLTAGLLKDQIYSSFLPLVRKGFFILLSGHSGTGQMTIYATQFLTQWGDVGLIAVILVMLFGGWSASTAGGFKAIRIGIVFKSILSDIQQFLIPRTSVYVSKYRHLADRILNVKTIKTTMNIIALYMFIHLFGAVVGVLNGYPLVDSFFESVSATANVGLSCGITSSTMPFNMKIAYIINMYLGRLEFTAVIVLISYIVNGILHRKNKESKAL